ncbi:MAG TPA: hypothetical protein HA340_01105 [Candidatus Thalassarchaeaceae archaeon]|jgi:heme/copper-type cytochrome/quinol oxidase subunit 3|nr:hypothetical protein [Euryarchaeota archaeon]MDP6378594.1 hypothetical protein [Candidatus Thalassarchaeaceae archaeon]DAC51871.1 MAG TPA: hypothetical protein D7H97_01075 [Candidatus Poseidoniales archaeon]HIH82523.1 hypothetical protein [Candidatus Thalassarchaeaceae archaeon]|tara:strand:- start:313 stop:570 length:258 start_codon:yes stop_codon:yes gene_type:complete
MATLEMSDEEFVAESRRRGRKISSVLLALSIACYFMARMLTDTRTEDAIRLAWTSVTLAVGALFLLVIVMPVRKLLRRRKRMAKS